MATEINHTSARAEGAAEIEIRLFCDDARAVEMRPLLDELSERFGMVADEESMARGTVFYVSGRI